jgi:hypothetical protein
MASTPTATPKSTDTPNVVPPMLAQDRDKALKILAKSICKELKAQGYESKHIVSLATELLSTLTDDARSDAPR